jgi:hypothetical protein
MVLLAACGGDKAPTDERLCQKMTTLSDGELPCMSARDWATMEHDVGHDAVVKVRACTASAQSTEALVLCWAQVGVYASKHVSDKRHKSDRVSKAEERDTSSPSVHFDSVTVKPTEDDFGHQLALSIELTVTSAMPRGRARVHVEAACGLRVDVQDAFFMMLSDAQPGDKRSDTVKLFEIGDALPAAPARCELILSLTVGVTPPAKYCYQDGRTVEGACK